jgi:hypothetical protein
MTDTSTSGTAPLRLKLDLPGVAAESAAELGREIGALDAVEAASAAPTRFALGGIVMLVQLAGGALANAGAVASVVERLVALVRGKGVTGARIELPGGGSIEVDHASVEDIERLVGAIGGGRVDAPAVGGG